MSTNAPASGGAISRLHKKLGASPFMSFCLGALVVVLWICGTIVQIQTSEFLALGSPTRVATVAWGVLMQPWLLISGQAPIHDATAWMYGWVVEAVTLVFALVLSVAVVKISSVNPHLGRGFIAGGFVLLILNSWADYSSAPGNSWLIQGLIALAVGGIVVVGLPLGVGLIEHAIEEF